MWFRCLGLCSCGSAPPSQRSSQSLLGPGLAACLRVEERLDVKGDLDPVADNDLGAVCGQAEGDSEVAAADRAQGREADPRLSLQACGSVPRKTTSSSTGAVTSRIVRSPDSTHEPSTGRSAVLAKVITG
jgi:hypothetical protein